MAYPTVEYNASTGSDTSPTGNDGSGTNGDISGTTLTLNETVDFTGVGDDDTDYLWYAGSAGDRHLFQITAFSPSVGACTSLTLAETATTRNGSNWAVNGIRQTLENDSSRPDWEDCSTGWVFEFDAGTYDVTADCDPVIGAPEAGGGGYLEWRAKSGAASRPVIRATADVKILEPSTAGSNMVVRGLKFTTNAGTKNNTYVSKPATGSIHFIDCVFDANGSAYCFYSAGQGGKAFVDCYFTGATTYGVRLASADNDCLVYGCTFDGDGGSYFSTAAFYIGNSGAATSQVVILQSLFDGASGDAVFIGASAYTALFAIGNTIVGSGGDGIQKGGQAGSGWSGQLGMYLNNIFTHNTGYGARGSNDADSAANYFLDHCAFYSNTAGEILFQDFTSGSNNLSLSADPFTNRTGGDFTLNDTAGGGAACTGVGFPSTFPDGT